MDSRPRLAAFPSLKSPRFSAEKRCSKYLDFCTGALAGTSSFQGFGVCVRRGRRRRRPGGRGLLLGAVRFRGSPRLLVQYLFDLLFERRQILLDSAPDNFDIHIKVIVDHLVAHATHFDPR